MGPLDQARWERVRDAFDAVAALPPAARAERLTALCGDDPEVHAEVESLLAHDRSADDPIGRLVGRAAHGAAETANMTGVGRRLLHYRLTEPIGEGGMGIVWRAADETLGRDVAIKLLPPSLGHDPRRLARFEREAKLLASLNHTNIAAIFSLHSLDDVPFLAMEFVPGEDLAARLARGPIPLDETLGVARQIAEALEEAHERGVVHRDLKPANVKLTPSGRVKVLDFGLAKAFAEDLAGGSSTSSASLLAPLSTREGVVLGTAAYMPPEQARGLAVDKRSDIWAFGVVLFEMVAGRRPFVGGTDHRPTGGDRHRRARLDAAAGRHPVRPGSPAAAVSPERRPAAPARHRRGPHRPRAADRRVGPRGDGAGVAAATSRRGAGAPAGGPSPRPPYGCRRGPWRLLGSVASPVPLARPRPAAGWRCCRCSI